MGDLDLIKTDLQRRLDAALHVVVFGVDQTGIATKRALMMPFDAYTDNDVKKSAVNLIKACLLVGLSDAPHQQIAQILQDQFEYLSFVCGDG